MSDQPPPRDRVKAIVNSAAELLHRKIMTADEKCASESNLKAVADLLTILDLSDEDAVRRAVAYLEVHELENLALGPFGIPRADACETAIIILKSQLPPDG